MGVQRGMNIVTNGLVSYWDTTNPKCYNTYNLLQYTQDYTNAAWTKLNSTITPNATLAPDGTLTASKLIEGAINGTHYILQNITSVIGRYYTVSFYVKAGERTSVNINNSDQITASIYSFDLINGICTFYFGEQNSYGNILNVGNGWWKCSVTRFISAGTIMATQIALLDNLGNVGYTGNGTSGVYVWGAQINFGKRNLPYQPNLTTLPVSTAVNDLMKNANGTLTNGTLVNASEGIFTFDGVDDYVTMGDPSNLVLNSSITLSAWIKIGAFSAVNPILGRWGSPTTKSYKLAYLSTGDLYLDITLDGATDNYVKTTQKLLANTWYHVAGVYDKSAVTITMYINGVQQAGTVVGTIPSAIFTGASSFTLGNDSGGINKMTGQVAFPMVYNRTLSAQEVWQNYNATKERFIINP